MLNFPDAVYHDELKVPTIANVVALATVPPSSRQTRSSTSNATTPIAPPRRQRNVTPIAVTCGLPEPILAPIQE